MRTASKPPRLTGRGVGMLAAASITSGLSLVLSLKWLAAITFALWLLPVIGLLLVSLPRRTIRHTLDFHPFRVHAPGPVNVEWRIAPVRRRAGSCDLTLFVDGAPAHRVRVSAISGEELVAVPLTLTRGQHVAGPIREVFHDPFRCAQRTREVSISAETLVWPSVCTIDVPQELLGRESGLLRSRRRSGSDDLVQLRSYQQGDDPRRIHWRSTARRGEMLVRDDHDGVRKFVSVVLDASSQVDLGTAVTASLVLAAVGEGVATEIHVPGGAPFNVVSHREALEVLDALARLTACTAPERDEISSTFSFRGPVVLVAPLSAGVPCEVADFVVRVGPPGAGIASASESAVIVTSVESMADEWPAH